LILDKLEMSSITICPELRRNTGLHSYFLKASASSGARLRTHHGAISLPLTFFAARTIA
jgi:hypothetical protein